MIFADPETQMPEQLTKHPEVTIQVLRSAGVKCGEGSVQEILTKCPADSFCKLPGGEICVYGLADASKMTQISTSELQSLVPRPESAAPPSAIPGAFFYFAVVCALLVGAALGAAVTKRRRT
jgi:uncharacterized protein YneF (UPF0154 family)